MKLRNTMIEEATGKSAWWKPMRKTKREKISTKWAEKSFFKSGLFTHSQWSQNVQRVQCIGSETKLEAHYSTFFVAKKKNPTH